MELDSRYFYGVSDPVHLAVDAQVVCDVLGHGSGYAVQLLLETACQETRLSTYRDRTDYSAGHGVCQFDRIGFVDVQQRTNPRLVQLIKDYFDVDIGEVEHRELEHSPLLSMIFCRLFYLLRPGAIPSSLEGRAAYWKKYFNTSAGKGSAAEYIDNWNRFGSEIVGDAI